MPIRTSQALAAISALAAGAVLLWMMWKRKGPQTLYVDRAAARNAAAARTEEPAAEQETEAPCKGQKDASDNKKERDEGE